MLLRCSLSEFLSEFYSLKCRFLISKQNLQNSFWKWNSIVLGISTFPQNGKQYYVQLVCPSITSSMDYFWILDSSPQFSGPLYLPTIALHMLTWALIKHHQKSICDRIVLENYVWLSWADWGKFMCDINYSCRISGSSRIWEWKGDTDVPN